MCFDREGCQCPNSHTSIASLNSDSVRRTHNWSLFQFLFDTLSVIIGPSVPRHSGVFMIGGVTRMGWEAAGEPSAENALGAEK